MFGCFGLTLASLGLLGLIAVLSSRGRVGDRPMIRGGVDRGDASVDLLPEVATFFASHREFGKPVGSSAVPPWAKGRRQNVRTDRGQTLFFCEKGGAVVTVYRNDPPSPRSIVRGSQDAL